MSAPQLRRRGGFTLIELMLVVAIIGLMAAVAIPSYQRYIRRSRTVEGVYSVSKMLHAAKVVLDSKSKVPCNAICDMAFSGFSIDFGSGLAPTMTLDQACASHGGAFPMSTVADFSGPLSLFDQIQFAPEGSVYRFQYRIYSLLYRIGTMQYGGFLASAQSDPACSKNYVIVYGALIPPGATSTVLTPTVAYGLAPNVRLDWGTRGPIVRDNCQDWSCP